MYKFVFMILLGMNNFLYASPLAITGEMLEPVENRLYSPWTPVGIEAFAPQLTLTTFHISEINIFAPPPNAFPVNSLTWNPGFPSHSHPEYSNFAHQWEPGGFPVNPFFYSYPAFDQLLPIQNPYHKRYYETDGSLPNKSKKPRAAIEQLAENKETESPPQPVCKDLVELAKENIEADLKERKSSNIFIYRYLSIPDKEQRIEICSHAIRKFAENHQNSLLISHGSHSLVQEAEILRKAIDNPKIKTIAYQTLSRNKKTNLASLQAVNNASQNFVLVTKPWALNRQKFQLPDIGLILIDEKSNFNSKTHHLIAEHYSNAYIIWLKTRFSKKNIQIMDKAAIRGLNL